MRAFIPVLLLTACGSVNPVTLLQLASLDPLTADPAGFEVALSLPEGIELSPEGAQLRLSAERGEDLLSGAFDLEQSSGTPPLWRIAPDQVQALRELQQGIAAWEVTDPDGTSGSFSVDLAPCRIGVGPSNDATASIDLRISPDGALLPLVQDAPFSEVMDVDTVAQLPICLSEG